MKPFVRHYLGNLDAGLTRTGYAAPLRVMLSNGDFGSTETAVDFPLRLIESGAVAGAIVGRQIAQALGLPEVLSFGMGGTTAVAQFDHRSGPKGQHANRIASRSPRL